MKQLNIGCGYNKMEGFINIDSAKAVNPDMVVDIEKGLPFEDDSIDYIYSEHCLEHIRPEAWRFVLSEIARVAKHGCILELHLPFDNRATRTHIDHYRTFTWSSFDQYVLGNDKRFYYSPLKLIWNQKKPSKFTRMFFNTFPLLKDNIDFRFEIAKGAAWKN